MSNCVAKLRLGNFRNFTWLNFCVPANRCYEIAPTMIQKLIKQIFTKFYPGRVSPRIIEKFQFWLKHDTKNGHIVYKDLHTCFSAHTLRITCYIPCSRITFPSQVAEIQVPFEYISKHVD
jgi:hypothetical protein